MVRKVCFQAALDVAGTLVVASAISVARVRGREPVIQPARVNIHASKDGCKVELDTAPAGKTDAHGTLVLAEVEPGGHYLHIQCPGEQEHVYFISARAGDRVEVRHGPSEAGAPPLSSLETAQVRIRLRDLVQQAVRLRALGRFDEAVERLREAAQLDPENSDLHRELGITFLLNKDWKRGRVEMLEAIRHKPDDADAHNGLGYALEKLGKLEAALKEYRTATHLEPDDVTYRQHYLEAIGKVAAQKAGKKK